MLSLPPDNHPSNTPNPAATLPAADLIACAATTDDPTLQVGCTRASLRRAALSRSQNALGVHLVPEKLKALQPVSYTHLTLPTILLV